MSQVSFKQVSEQLAYLKKACEEERLSTILMGLDVLGNTKWIVNKKVRLIQNMLR